MGMDVYGQEPTTEAGQYFRNNVWGWRPLAEYILSVAPVKITSQCERWHSNDGDGLDKDNSLLLAAALRNEIISGRTAEYAAKRQEQLDGLPLVDCEQCHGTGIRDDERGREAGYPEMVIDEEGHPRNGQTGWCNGCDGRGKNKDFTTHYSFEVENVAEFCDFLEGCGGFAIC